MHVRQHVVLDAADLKRLTAGKPLTLTLDNTVIDLSLALDGAGGANHGSRPTLAGSVPMMQMRGDCPHCESTDVLLATHIRHAHPDKPKPSYTGAGAVACPTCKRSFPSRRSLVIHRVTHKQTKADRERSNAKRIATMKAKAKAKAATGGPA
jgi:hypothetical protein